MRDIRTNGSANISLTAKAELMAYVCDRPRAPAATDHPPAEFYSGAAGPSGRFGEGFSLWRLYPDFETGPPESWSSNLNRTNGHQRGRSVQCGLIISGLIDIVVLECQSLWG